MSSSEPPQPKRRSVINPSPPGLATPAAEGESPVKVSEVSPTSLPPVKVDTLMTGDAKVATHPQSMVGPAPAPQFQTLGRYTIIGELGRGGMGVVYLSDDTVLKRKVALKIPQFEPHKADQMQARFIREAQMAAQLSHINICQIYDVGVIDGQYVMAMEYIDGKTLSDFTKAGKLISERQAVYFVRKVAIAVETAHQKGLIHRDLKPGNIMLPKADPVTKVIEPKVMDFGLAKSLEARTTELTKSGMIVGTPCYMSKEQWSGREAQLGPQCDIYSLGIILYELLTGKLPYDVDDEEPATAWFVKLVTQPQIRPTERKADVDPALDAIVMRSIAKEAPDRYPSMAQFAKDLDVWLKGKAKPAGQSLVGQLPPGLLPLAPPPVNMFLDLGDIESIKSQPSFSKPTRRKPPGAIPAWLLWAAGGAAVFLLGIVVIFTNSKGEKTVVRSDGSSATLTTPEGTFSASASPATEPVEQGIDSSSLRERPPTGDSILPVVYRNKIGMEFAKVPKGKSWLGGGGGKFGDSEVEFKEDFYLGKYEVTQEEWEKVMGDNPSWFSRGGAEKNAARGAPDPRVHSRAEGSTDISKFTDADLKRFPVEEVSWNDCQEFLVKLNTLTNETGWEYRLPKEVEWEYAYRGGPMTDRFESAFDFYLDKPSNQLMPDQQNFGQFGTTWNCRVGTYKPNRLGLHDMPGNVHEWCEEGVPDPNGPPGTIRHVVRGGCAFHGSGACSASWRGVYPPSPHPDYEVGFRVARVLVNKDAIDTVKNDYDAIATGKWVRLLDASTPLPDTQKMKFTDDVLELNDAGLPFEGVSARNVILRAQVKKVSGQNLAMGVRRSRASHAYIVWFNGGNWFGIGKLGTNTGTDLVSSLFGSPKDDYFEMAISAVEDTITLYVDGKAIYSAKDSELDRGAVAISTLSGTSHFKNVEMMVLDTEGDGK